MNDINSRIALIVECSKLKPYTFAKKYELTPSYLNDIVKGNKTPKLEWLRDFANKLNINTNWLENGFGYPLWHLNRDATSRGLATGSLKLPVSDVQAMLSHYLSLPKEKQDTLRPKRRRSHTPENLCVGVPESLTNEEPQALMTSDIINILEETSAGTEVKEACEKCLSDDHIRSSWENIILSKHPKIRDKHKKEFEELIKIKTLRDEIEKYNSTYYDHYGPHKSTSDYEYNIDGNRYIIQFKDSKTKEVNPWLNVDRFLEKYKSDSCSHTVTLNFYTQGVPCGNAKVLDDKTEQIEIPAANAKGVDFLVRASGNSMRDKGIVDGSLLYVKEQNYLADSGHVMLVQFNGGSACRIVEHDFENKKYKLIPANPDYETEVYGPHDVHFIGRVMKVEKDL